MAAVDNFAPGGDFISLQAEGAWEARPGPSGLGVGLVWAWGPVHRLFGPFLAVGSLESAVLEVPEL